MRSSLTDQNLSLFIHVYHLWRPDGVCLSDWEGWQCSQKRLWSCCWAGSSPWWSSSQEDQCDHLIMGKKHFYEMNIFMRPFFSFSISLFLFFNSSSSCFIFLSFCWFSSIRVLTWPLNLSSPLWGGLIESNKLIWTKSSLDQKKFWKNSRNSQKLDVRNNPWSVYKNMSFRENKQADNRCSENVMVINEEWD